MDCGKFPASRFDVSPGERGKQGGVAVRRAAQSIGLVPRHAHIVLVSVARSSVVANIFSRRIAQGDKFIGEQTVFPGAFYRFGVGQPFRLPVV